MQGRTGDLLSALFVTGGLPGVTILCKDRRHTCKEDHHDIWYAFAVF
jgi:hypothetical protein